MSSQSPIYAHEAMGSPEINLLFDACGIARRIMDIMPPLPQGIKPRHIHVIDAIWRINHDPSHQGKAHVSDVAASFGILMPSVTKLVAELVDKQLVNKSPSSTDGRSMDLSLTARGEQYRQQYVTEFHNEILPRLSSLQPGDAQEAIRVMSIFLTAVEATMNNRTQGLQ